MLAWLRARHAFWISLLTAVIGGCSTTSGPPGNDADSPTTASRFGDREFTTVNPWAAQTAPAPGPLRILGRVEAGCLAGARELPTDGRGYHRIRLGRGRGFGSPELVALIERAGRHFAGARGRRRGACVGALLVGDLSQPRGGPANGGHQSHQTGLDADIWYQRWPFPTALVVGAARGGRTRPPTGPEREDLAPSSMNEPGAWPSPGAQPLQLREKEWRESCGDEVLAWFARAPEVDRIFVTPTVKKRLCAEFGADPSGSNEDWLRKVRPWWGHDYHFHVRIRCPSSAGHDCVENGEIPKSSQVSGCDETLDWWFGEEARAQAWATGIAAREAEALGEPKRWPVLPDACEGVLKNPKPPAD